MGIMVLGHTGMLGNAVYKHLLTIHHGVEITKYRWPTEGFIKEMVSSEEWRKTEELKNFFLIGNDIINYKQHSYNSLDYLMDSSDAYKFLKESGVIK